MPDIAIELGPWAAGTTVELVPRISELHMDDMPPPGVQPIASAIVAADDSLTFVGVPVGSYWAIAPVGARYQYLAVFAQEGFVPV